jgi:ClpP class serine protease
VVGRAQKNLPQSNVTKLLPVPHRDAGRGREKMAKAPTVSVSEDGKADTIESIDQKLLEKRKKLSEARGMSCFPMLLPTTNIGNKLVDDIYDDLKTNFSTCNKIDVVLDSGGGSVDAAFNIALLFREFAPERLSFIIPRWAKSAATLLACSGDEILMTPPAELGPLDPQITEMNPLEKRMEQFSPLHIESTLELIREEFANGHEKLAT